MDLALSLTNFTVYVIDDDIVSSGAKFPYSNIFGSSVVPKILSDVEFSALSDSVHHRAEWNIFVGNPREHTATLS
jgi:hypothetical protein